MNSFRNIYRVLSTLPIKYGLNPHSSAKVLNYNSNIKLLNGIPSYINYLDAIQSWNLISSIKINNYDKVVSTSFKHTTPTGLSLNNKEIVDGIDKGVKKSFIDSRFIDPLSSFGDFIAISDEVNEETARVIKNFVSDGIIAHSFTDKAYDLLKGKKKGKYIIFSGTYKEYLTEIRELNGIKFTLKNNKYILNNEKINDLIENNEMTSTYNNFDSITKKNLELANNILNFVPSNSVAIAYDNKVIGVGAGQQNRVDCIRIAGKKAYNYLEKNKINKEEAKLVLASDGFLPFEDNIEECMKYNIKYIIQPGGSIKDKDILNMCILNNIKMIKTGHRLFLH